MNLISLRRSLRHLGMSLTLSALVGCGSSPSAEPRSTTAAVAATSESPTEPPTSVAPNPILDGDARIVVQAPSSTGDGIYLLGADGGVDAQLAPDVGSAKHPDWSPDGATLVFANDADGALWTVGADGSNPQQLLACDAGCLALDFPAFSPDGRHVAYTRYEPPNGDGPPAASTIRVLDLDAMRSVDVVRSELPELVDVARWSPDGQQIVLGIDVFDDEFNESGSTIAVVSASGGDVRRLVDDTTFAYAPDWNAQTGEILYSIETMQYRAASDKNDEPLNLWAVAADGSGVRQLTDVSTGQVLMQPSWTPDGAAILATLEGGTTTTRQIVLVDPTNGMISPVATTLSTHGRLQPAPP